MCYNRIGFIFVSPTAADATHWIEKKKTFHWRCALDFTFNCFNKCWIFRRVNDIRRTKLVDFMVAIACSVSFKSLELSTSASREFRIQIVCRLHRFAPFLTTWTWTCFFFILMKVDALLRKKDKRKKITQRAVVGPSHFHFEYKIWIWPLVSRLVASSVMWSTSVTV